MPTILLIDSDDDTREILQTLLAWQGYELLTARDAAAGLRIARHAQPDVIVTEFLIPPTCGRCVIEELRRTPETAGIPAVVFTSNVWPEVAERVERAGGVFAAKPNQPTVLLRLVQRACPQAG